MIRVLIVDDHSVVRAGLAQLVSGAGDMEVAGAVASGADAIAHVAGDLPDVVLMDLSMPGLDGSETTRRLLAQHPELRIVVLTSFSDRPVILDALEAGAIGYLLKDVEPDELLRGIRAADRGESPLAPKAASTVLATHVRRRALELTDREQEVLRLVGAGLPNKAIAANLEISEKTVKAHLTSIFSRIGVSDRTQAALWAQRRGLV